MGQRWEWAKRQLAGVHAPTGTTYFDAQDGFHARYRRANREASTLRAIRELTAEQRRTNEMLEVLVGAQGVVPPPPPRP